MFLEQMFQILERGFDNLARSRGFERLSGGAERHGAVQWAYYKNDVLHRYVIYSLVPSEAAGHGTLQTRFGSDNGTTFKREELSPQDIDLHGPAMPSLPPDPFDRALAMQAVDLDTEILSAVDYLPPRTRTASSSSW